MASLTVQNEGAMRQKMAETLARGYSPESTLQDLSNEYQHGRVWRAKNVDGNEVVSLTVVQNEGSAKQKLLPSSPLLRVDIVCT